MSYNTSKLLTTNECDAAIAMATERIAALSFNQTIQSKGLTDQERLVASTNASLLVVKAQIGGTESALVGLPEGKDRTRLSDQLRRLNDRKGNLEARLRDAGSAALLDTELDSGLLRAQVSEIDAYITEVADRKAAI